MRKLLYTAFLSAVVLSLGCAVTNYTLQHQVIAGGVLRSPLGGKDNAQAFYTGKVNEAPRTIMTPMGGPAFVQGLLSPIPTSVVVSLLQSSGWSADRVLQTMLYAANGKRNLHVMYDDGWKLDIDPGFATFVDAVSDAHLDRAISVLSKIGGPRYGHRVWLAAAQAVILALQKKRPGFSYEAFVDGQPFWLSSERDRLFGPLTLLGP